MPNMAATQRASGARWPTSVSSHRSRYVRARCEHQTAGTAAVGGFVAGTRFGR